MGERVEGEGRRVRTERTAELPAIGARGTASPTGAPLRELVPTDRESGAELAEARATIARLTAGNREESAALERANSELVALTQSLDGVVRQRTRALAESEVQLRRKNAELDRLNLLKAEFIAIAAHELRTPTTSIVGYLDMISEGRTCEVPQELARPLTVIRRNAVRLKRLLDHMFDASRLETGRVALSRSACDLGEIATAVVEELVPLAEQRRHVLSLVVSPLAPIDADPDRIHQVLANLVVNAVRYTPDRGAIRVQVDDEHGRARVRVWDNGIGMSPAVRARIFEPFTDVHPSRYHTSSSPDSAGLGLFIARGLVALHGGTIFVESDEGCFSEFTVLLPYAATA
ncbi:MAG: HAMP domain-containing histidine kinase [Myxococcales bacterium]|nr:HAMP domain-containing histidine kinase [Myxococcales bacterium]